MICCLELLPPVHVPLFSLRLLFICVGYGTPNLYEHHKSFPFYFYFLSVSHKTRPSCCLILSKARFSLLFPLGMQSIIIRRGESSHFQGSTNEINNQNSKQPHVIQKKTLSIEIYLLESQWSVLIARCVCKIMKI